MELHAYEWFKNPRGLRNDGPFKPFYLERYTLPRLGWARLEAGADEYVDAAAKLVANQIMPVVRLWRERMSGLEPPSAWWDHYKAYLAVGCRWFELYEEPNMEHAWPQSSPGVPGVHVDWDNVEGCIGPLMDRWGTWAERIIDLGGYPAFPALAQTTAHRHATVHWYDASLRYLHDQHAQRFSEVATRGLWLAVHPEMRNLFYQEPPGGPAHAARPYYQQRAEEGGWHFEHPYDPLCQREDPGRTVFGGTTSTPYGDPHGLIASGDAFRQLLEKYFGLGPVPVLGTAGGIALPGPGEEPRQPDPSYPAYSFENHAEAVLAMYQWIAQSSPPWFFGVTLSDESDYYEKLEGPAPSINRMASVEPVLKQIPVAAVREEVAAPRQPKPAPAEPAQPLSVSQQPPLLVSDRPSSPETARILKGIIGTAGAAPMEDVPVETAPSTPPAEALDFFEETYPPTDAAASQEPAPTSTLAAGPAPVVGEPDHHWLMLASDLPADWFFSAGRLYWDAFKPVIAGDPAQIVLLPPTESLAVTLLATPASQDSFVRAIRHSWPTVHIDLVVVDSAASLAQELNRRVGLRRALG